MQNFMQAQLEMGIAEITINYSVPIPKEKRIQVNSSRKAYEVFSFCWQWDTLEYQERVYVLLLNQSKHLLGFHLHSIGGKASAVIDRSQILALALRSNASSIILGHNHPSGSLEFSPSDKELTLDLDIGAQQVGIQLLDHLIVTKTAYASLADNDWL